MSATLTWHAVGPSTKSGTTVTDAWTDLKALIDTVLANSDYKWRVASSNVGSSPRQITLKRKDGSAGRILLCSYDSIPGTYPTVMFGSAPVANNLFFTYFPAGNVDTPASLVTNASPVLGVDTGLVQASCLPAITSVYTTGTYWFYAENEEGIFIFSSTTSNSQYYGGAGDLLVDANDVAYPCTFGSGNSILSAFSSPSSQSMGWSNSRSVAGPTIGGIRTNYGAPDRQYFQAFGPGGWGNQSLDATSLLADTATQKAWFIPVLLMSNSQQPGTSVRGEGMPLKLRQFAYGPGALSGPLPSYSTTGPVVQAIYPHGGTGTAQSLPWLTNFKL